MAIWLAWPINGQAAKKSKGKKSFVTCQLVMQAHEGESILSYLLSVYALEKTKPPSGGSQAVFSTPVTNKQKISIIFRLNKHFYMKPCRQKVFII